MPSRVGIFFRFSVKKMADSCPSRHVADFWYLEFDTMNFHLFIHFQYALIARKTDICGWTNKTYQLIQNILIYSQKNAI